MVYRIQPDVWVAEIPAIAGCHALMPTAEEAVAELAEVFRLIEAEHRAVVQEVLDLLDEPQTRLSRLPRKSRRTHQNR